MHKFFRIPFASSGDKTSIPDPIDTNGNVSYTQGYGLDYQRQKTDPAAKDIERDKQNQLFFDFTTAVAELQSQGIPDFITAALNGGTAYSYAANAVVRWTDGDIYTSLVAANTSDPTDLTKWALMPTAARVRDGANTIAACTGAADAITLALTPTQTAFSAGPTWWRATAANVTTAPTVKRDGLAAKTLVKGNNLPVVAGDIPGAGAWMVSQYDATLDKEVLLNPATGVTPVQSGAAIQGAFKNLKASASGVDSSINISCDEIIVKSADNAYKTLQSFSLAINSSTVGVSGLDVGPLAASTWYSTWVIWNGTTAAGLISLSATAPTLPSGYTHKSRIGWMRTDATANKFPLGFVQFGRRAQYLIAAGSNLTALPVMITGVQGSFLTTLVSASVSSFVPPTAAAIGVHLYVPGGYGQVSPNSTAAITGSSITNGASGTINNRLQAWFNLESSNIYYAANGPTANVSTLGWEDNL